MVGLKSSHGESDSQPKTTDDSGGRGARRGALLSALADEGGWCFVPERTATSAAGSRSCDCAQRNPAVGGNRVSPPSGSSWVMFFPLGNTGQGLVGSRWSCYRRGGHSSDERLNAPVPPPPCPPVHSLVGRQFHSLIDTVWQESKREATRVGKYPEGRDFE